MRISIIICWLMDFIFFKKEFELDAVAGCRSTFDAPSDEGLGAGVFSSFGWFPIGCYSNNNHSVCGPSAVEEQLMRAPQKHLRADEVN